MFTKKTRRNFRQRKENSSDEEEEQRDNNVAGKPEKDLPAVNKPLRLAQNRGITCSSKRESTPPKPHSSDEEDGETVEVTKEVETQKKEKNEINDKTSSILSFSDDKDGIFLAFRDRPLVGMGGRLVLTSFVLSVTVTSWGTHVQTEKVQ